jgi:predicted metalloprotease with PDZ domain
MAPPAAEHVFLLEPGMGGTHTEGAISMGWPELGKGERFEAGTAQFIAHESFHAWLPGVLKSSGDGDGDGLEWFFEGFTDYFALWHLGHIGAITPQEFGDQLRLVEQIGKTGAGWGNVAFADLTVKWRDDANEPVAYRGGALLAFHLDTELRLRGEPGLPQLFRDLAAENGSRYDLAALEKWCAANGLEEAWQSRVVAPFRPSTDDDLVRLGWRERREGESRIITAAGADLAAFFSFPK